MPFYRADPEVFRHLGEKERADLPKTFPRKEPTGEFDYTFEEDRFDPSRLGDVSRFVLETVRQKGALSLRISYDNGFARLDRVTFADGDRAPREVATELADAVFVEQVLLRAGRSKWSAHILHGNKSSEEIAEAALDELVRDLVSRFLGGGFGTGPFDLYGSFIADLWTGEMIDDPDAKKPDHLD